MNGVITTRLTLPREIGIRMAMGAALTAAWWLAAIASRVDPVVALRYE